MSKLVFTVFIFSPVAFGQVSKFINRIVFFGLCVSILSVYAAAQTSAFSYQGRLSESGSPVTGTRFVRFTLFDETGAAIPGASIEQTVPVANGVFNATLDFGAANFPGANRSLEIAVKINVGDAYTVLNPRQNILSVPYSVKSKTAENSNQLGGVDATRYVQQDAGGNVSIGGNLTVSGTATYDTVNAATQYNLNNFRILAANPVNSSLSLGFFTGNTVSSFNTFLGTGAGNANPTGTSNVFVGDSSGLKTTIGNGNSFLGSSAGAENTSGAGNSIFGHLAGQFNQTGNDNSFFGRFAGQNNTAGNNSFFGAEAGFLNQTGTRNAFFGRSAGFSNTASNNSFFGFEAGKANTNGNSNAFFGMGTGSSNQGGSANSFFGSGAGLANISGGSNSFFGGLAGSENTAGVSNSFFGQFSGLRNQGSFNTFIGFAAAGNVGISTALTGARNTIVGSLSAYTLTNGSDNSIFGANANFGANNLNFASAFGANAVVNSNDTIVLGKIAGTYNGIVRPADTIRIPGLLIVSNLIESNSGGFKFPDGTIQTTAFTGTSSSFIQNQTMQQTGANFNIAGTGTANIFNAATQFNIGSSRILSGSESGGNIYAGFNNGTNTGFNNAFFGNNAGAVNTASANTFIGFNSGAANIGGTNNAFLGTGSGINNQNGFENTFVGAGAGSTNVDGARNSFFGASAGFNSTGEANSFFGNRAGFNTSGFSNTFVGWQSGQSNTAGNENVYVGTNTGEFSQTGNQNTFIGAESGRANSNGSGNTFIGYNAQGSIGNNYTNATAIGANSAALQNNSLILGSINGVNGATSDTRVGIGTTTPKAKLDVTNGNILVGSPGQGIILKSPNGATCRLLSIDNAGALALTAIACP